MDERPEGHSPWLCAACGQSNSERLYACGKCGETKDPGSYVPSEAEVLLSGLPGRPLKPEELVPFLKSHEYEIAADINDYGALSLIFRLILRKEPSTTRTHYA